MARTTPKIGEPTAVDIVRRRGDTKSLRIKLTEKGKAVDVTGYTAVLTIDTVQFPPDNTTNVFQAPGVPDAVPTSGVMIFDFADFDSLGDDVQPGSYYYDVQVTDGSGRKFTPLVGAFSVVQDITKLGG